VTPILPVSSLFINNCNGGGTLFTTSTSKNYNNGGAAAVRRIAPSGSFSIFMKNNAGIDKSVKQFLLHSSLCKMSQNENDNDVDGDIDDDDDYDDYDDDEYEEDEMNEYEEDDMDDDDEEAEDESSSMREAVTYFLQSSGFSSPSTTEESNAVKEAMSQKETDSRVQYNNDQLQRARYLQPQNVLRIEKELNQEWKLRQDTIDRAVQKNNVEKAKQIKADWMNRIVNGTPVKVRDRSKQIQWEKKFRNKMIKERMVQKEQEQKEQQQQQQQESKEETKVREERKKEQDAAVVAAGAAEEARKQKAQAQAKAEAAAAAAAKEEAERQKEEVEKQKKEQRIAAEKARAAEAAAKAQAEAEAQQVRLLREKQAKEAAEAAAKAAEEEEERKQREEEDALLQPLADKATGIVFAPKIGDDDLYLIGVGVRKKAFVSIYSVGMYTSRDVKMSLEDFLEEHDKKEALTFLHDSIQQKLTSSTTTISAEPSKTKQNPFKTSFLLQMAFSVGAETMSSTIAESVGQRYRDGPMEVTELKDLIFAGVKAKGSATKGTTFLFECSSDNGLTVSVDGEVQGTVNSVELASAFVNVYLDEKGASPSLKENILQYCCAP